MVAFKAVLFVKYLRDIACKEPRRTTAQAQIEVKNYVVTSALSHGLLSYLASKNVTVRARYNENNDDTTLIQ